MGKNVAAAESCHNGYRLNVLSISMYMYLDRYSFICEYVTTLFTLCLNWISSNLVPDIDDIIGLLVVISLPYDRMCSSR